MLAMVTAVRPAASEETISFVQQTLVYVRNIILVLLHTVNVAKVKKKHFSLLDRSL